MTERKYLYITRGRFFSLRRSADDERRESRESGSVSFFHEKFNRYSHAFSFDCQEKLILNLRWEEELIDPIALD